MTNNKGLMIAGALILAAVYILSDEEGPFTVTFTLDALPHSLRKRIETVSDGMLITATRITKNSDFPFSDLSEKQFEGIVVNRMMTFFGRREKWSKS